MTSAESKASAKVCQDIVLKTKIVMLMKTNSKIKQTEIAEELKVSRATVQRAIRVLVDKQAIERGGES